MKDLHDHIPAGMPPAVARIKEVLVATKKCREGTVEQAERCSVPAHTFVRITDGARLPDIGFF